MKKLMIAALVTAMLATMAATTYADVFVKGHLRRDGTYVQPHWRSDPDGNFWNNWSTYPNVNPYTGKVGRLRTPPLRIRVPKPRPLPYFPSKPIPLFRSLDDAGLGW